RENNKAKDTAKGKDDANTLVSLLQNQGGLVFVRPDEARLPLLIRPANKITPSLSVLISAPKDLPAGTPVTVNAVGADGRILDARPVDLDVSERSAEVTFDIPEALRNQIHQIRIAGRK